MNIALFPGPRPASRRLQYSKATESWTGPGNEARVNIDCTQCVTHVKVLSHCTFTSVCDYMESTIVIGPSLLHCLCPLE